MTKDTSFSSSVGAMSSLDRPDNRQKRYCRVALAANLIAGERRAGEELGPRGENSPTARNGSGTSLGRALIPIGNGPDQFLIGVDPCAGELVRSSASRLRQANTRSNPPRPRPQHRRVAASSLPGRRTLDRPAGFRSRPHDCRYEKGIIGPEHTTGANEDGRRERLLNRNLALAARGDVTAPTKPDRRQCRDTGSVVHTALAGESGPRADRCLDMHPHRRFPGRARHARLTDVDGTVGAEEQTSRSHR